MRISDWSSDVCSSDLRLEGPTQAATGPQVRWQVPDVVAGEADPTGGGHEPADGVHERGLAGPVRADQADDLARGDGAGDGAAARAPARPHRHAAQPESAGPPPRVSSQPPSPGERRS